MRWGTMDLEESSDHFEMAVFIRVRRGPALFVAVEHGAHDEGREANQEGDGILR